MEIKDIVKEFEMEAKLLDLSPEEYRKLLRSLTKKETHGDKQ